MIFIHKSPTADTRTCDWSKVTKRELLKSNHQHQSDVRQGLDFFMELLFKTGTYHDLDKFTDFDGFYRDFITGFEKKEWWDNHRKVNRHHLSAADGVPDDVNLVDVIEHIVDCVMAGMARSGSVYELKLSDEVLQKAFKNTVELLKDEIVIEEDHALPM